MKFSKKEIESLIDGIYAGEITEYELPTNLYFAIADYLKSNLYKLWLDKASFLIFLYF